MGRINIDCIKCNKSYLYQSETGYNLRNFVCDCINEAIIRIKIVYNDEEPELERDRERISDKENRKDGVC